MTVKTIKLIAMICCVCIVFSFFGCKKNEEGNDNDKYIYTPATNTDKNGSDIFAVDGDFQKEFPKDTSWQNNYSVTYKYFNPTQGAAAASIREKKIASAFSVEYLDTGMLLYYRANGSDTDYFLISGDNQNNRHDVMKDKKISSLSSLFMKLTNVEPDLPSQSNVLYMYDEIIAGRNCHKYIQRAYSDAKLTESVYVWIDAQYGFAMKCEDYDASDELKTMWVVTEFSAGTLTEKDVIIDIGKYEFAEASE